MPQFRKKPIVIEAEQFRKGLPLPFVNDGRPIIVGDEGHPCVSTLEGEMRVSEGDWIIRGVKGEFYPCKPDVFDLTYEAVPDNLYAVADKDGKVLVDRDGWMICWATEKLAAEDIPSTDFEGTPTQVIKVVVVPADEWEEGQKKREESKIMWLEAVKKCEALRDESDDHEEEVGKLKHRIERLVCGDHQHEVDVLRAEVESMRAVFVPMCDLVNALPEADDGHKDSARSEARRALRAHIATTRKDSDGSD